MASIDITDIVSASVYSEKTRMKKLMMMMKMIIIMNKLQETTVFHGRPNLNSAIKQRPEKFVWARINYGSPRTNYPRAQASRVM